MGGRTAGGRFEKHYESSGYHFRGCNHLRAEALFSRPEKQRVSQIAESTRGRETGGTITL